MRSIELESIYRGQRPILSLLRDTGTPSHQLAVVEQPTRFTRPKSKRKQNSVPKCIRLIDKTRGAVPKTFNIERYRDTFTPVDCGRATNQVHRPKVKTETDLSTEVYKVNRQDKTPAPWPGS